MRFLSLFSGIEAAGLAWLPLGWTCVGVAEIDPFACSVLRHHHPQIPNLGDVTKIEWFDIAELGPLDLVVFGSPCQDLSVAGNRKGLAGERSGLFHDAMRIVRYAREHCRCRFALWENVPGAFTSNGGRDFAVVVAAMGGSAAVDVPPEGLDKKGNIRWCNEGVFLGEEALVEWATLDAQFAGVPQRRRRVFALADFGDWTRRPPVLLEPKGMRGNPPTRAGSREDVAGTLAGGARKRGGFSHDDVPLVAGTLKESVRVGGDPGQDGGGLLHVTAYMPARTFGADGVVDEIFAARDIADALHTSSGSGNKAPIIAFGGNNTSGPIEVAAAVNAKGGAGRMDFETETLLMGSFGVRRFTPRECERLQGFPDEFTEVRHRGKPAADGPRYKALGNSMAVPVMAHIGRSLEAALLDIWT